MDWGEGFLLAFGIAWGVAITYVLMRRETKELRVRLKNMMALAKMEIEHNPCWKMPVATRQESTGLADAKDKPPVQNVSSMRSVIIKCILCGKPLEFDAGVVREWRKQGLTLVARCVAPCISSDLSEAIEIS